MTEELRKRLTRRRDGRGWHVSVQVVDLEKREILR